MLEYGEHIRGNENLAIWLIHQNMNEVGACVYLCMGVGVLASQKGVCVCVCVCVCVHADVCMQLL